MMKLSPFAFISVFAISFVCFLLGWLFAVFVLPGQKLQHLAETKQKEQTLSAIPLETQTQDQPFLKEMTNNVLILFDPYKLDSLVKKDTKLGKESSFFKKSAGSIAIKKDSKPHLYNLQKKALKITEESEFLEEPSPALPTLSPELQEIQDGYDKKNREQLLLIKEEQKFFKPNGKFSFMVNVFSDQEKTFKYINQMKKQYPKWSFLIKAHKDHIRVYLGPFPSKQLAAEFKKTLPNPPPFSSLEFLEEVSL
ncbi:MAG: SPOR domain-containing protein [Oligoflexia bacterium]|nr:SPOR domain-containing protein [Oligoflexia bacterium]